MNASAVAGGNVGKGVNDAVGVGRGVKVVVSVGTDVIVGRWVGDAVAVDVASGRVVAVDDGSNGVSAATWATAVLSPAGVGLEALQATVRKGKRQKSNNAFLCNICNSKRRLVILSHLYPQWHIG
jgi:hypothetical protein